MEHRFAASPQARPELAFKHRHRYNSDAGIQTNRGWPYIACELRLKYAGFEASCRSCHKQGLCCSVKTHTMPPPCAVLYMRVVAQRRHSKGRPIIRKLHRHAIALWWHQQQLQGSPQLRTADDRAVPSENTGLLQEDQGREVFSRRGHFTPWAASMPWFNMQLASSMGPPTAIPLNCLQDPRAAAPAQTNISRKRFNFLPTTTTCCRHG